jgi:hypothetical protein
MLPVFQYVSYFIMCVVSFMFYLCFILLRRFVLAVYSHYVVVCKCVVCECCNSAK